MSEEQEDFKKLNDELDKYLKSVADLKTQEIKDIKKAHELYSGDEWKDAKKSSGQLYSLRIPKQVVERIQGSVLESPFQVEVLADNLPYFDPNSEYGSILQQFQTQLALVGEDAGKVVSELFTHACQTLRENLNLDEKISSAIELALIEGTCWLKDDVTLYEPDNLTVSVVTRDQIYKDRNAQDLDSLQWLCHKIPSTKEEVKKFFQDETDLEDKESKSGDDEFTSLTANDDGRQKKYTVEEWWLKDYTLEEADGILQPKYPGFWKRVYRFNKKIKSVEANPYYHNKLPFHPLVGITKPRSIDGMSLVLDILADLAVAKNKTVSLAIHNMEKNANNKRFINPTAVSVASRRDLASDTNSNIVLEEGYTWEQAFREPPPSDISNAFAKVDVLLNNLINEGSGARELPPPGQTAPSDGQDMIKTGYRIGLLRRRIKHLLQSVYYDLIMNLIGFVDENRAFRVMGGIGPSYIAFNPTIFQDAIENFNARFTIKVLDEEVLPSDPGARSQAVVGMLNAARGIAESTGLPLSTAVPMLPQLPGKNELSRKLIQKELQMEQQRMLQMQQGVDPVQAEANAMSERRRKEALAEVGKDALRELMKKDSILVSQSILNGRANEFLKIAQGEIEAPAGFTDLASFLAGVPVAAEEPAVTEGVEPPQEMMQGEMNQ